MTLDPGPLPPAGDVYQWDTDNLGVFRYFQQSRREHAGIPVNVVGFQRFDGNTRGWLSVDGLDVELTAADARRLAADLLDAAHELTRP